MKNFFTIFFLFFMLTHCGAPKNPLETNTATKQGAAVTSPPPQQPAPTPTPTPTTPATFSNCTNPVNNLSGISMAKPEISYAAATTNGADQLTVKFSISTYTPLEYEIDVPAGNNPNNPAHYTPRPVITGTISLQQPTTATASAIGYPPFFVRVVVLRNYNLDGSLPTERIEYTCRP